MPGMFGVFQNNSPHAQAGKFRHRIQIVQPTLSQDSTGGVDLRQNTVVITTWASIEALSGVEKFAAHEFSSNVTHKVWIRHPRSRVSGAITANMQVWFNTRQFQIEAVLNPVERKDYLMLLCIEIDDSVNQVTASPSEKSL